MQLDVILDDAARRLSKARYDHLKLPLSIRDGWYTTRDQWGITPHFEECCRIIQVCGDKYLDDRGIVYGLHLNGFTYEIEEAGDSDRIRRIRRHYNSPYDEIASVYDLKVNNEEIDQWRTKLGELIGSPPFWYCVLDLGCRTGWLLDTIGKNIHYANYDGIDTSKEMLRVHASKHPRYARDLINCSCDEFYPNRSYSLIVGAFGSVDALPLYHVKRFCRMLNHNGRCILMFRTVEGHHSATGDMFNVYDDLDRSTLNALRNVVAPQKIGHYDVFDISFDTYSEWIGKELV